MSSHRLNIKQGWVRGADDRQLQTFSSQPEAGGDLWWTFKTAQGVNTIKKRGNYE